MLHTHDGTFQSSCDAPKSYAMPCDAFSYMLVILLRYMRYLSCDGNRRREWKPSIVRSRLATLLRSFGGYLRWSAMVCDGLRWSYNLKIAGNRPISSQRVAGPLGPSTSCDAAHLRWDVLKHLQCIKIYCPIFKQFESLRWPFNRLSFDT